MGQIITQNSTGIEFEWLESNRQAEATHHINIRTGLIYEKEERPLSYEAALRKLPVRHVFGGLVYEETGEVRRVRLHEYYLNPEGELSWSWKWMGIGSLHYSGPRTILRPVTLVDSTNEPTPEANQDDPTN